ncbi:2'-phosphotransferase [Apostasia shenzhenica]|uniref:2'-phosphotransferase n=1 Tax=Apostasia shenzhenica TaxID=1088818 RepID=A0A2H9ZZR9_9ASPA|nr:2'-phosphotransferase [Apostasia shenzhenica]
MRVSASSSLGFLRSFSHYNFSLFISSRLVTSQARGLHHRRLLRMDKANTSARSSSSVNSKPFSSSVSASRRSGRGRGRDFGRGGTVADEDNRIDALGRLLTRVLRHMAAELNLDMRSDGFVRVHDLLRLNMSTYAKVPLKSHTIADIKEAVRRDNKQRFSLLEEDGELLIRANQGHTIKTVQSENLLKPILSADEVQVCVHGTYRKNLESILQSGLKRMQRLHVHFASGLPTDGEVISGMRRDVNMLIFLDVRKALQDGMKLYISDNKVVLTEGFDGVVPVKYFEKIETWPGRQRIPVQN